MKVFAHRGYSGKYPENTMLAYRMAEQTGCCGIELDVHETKDGELVIIHDETVDRTTDGTGRVCDMTLAELKKLNAAKLFPQLTDFEPIPSFNEYCEWVSGTKLVTNIEIKTDNVYYHDIEEKIWNTVCGFGLQDRVLFSSFNHISALRMKRLCGGVQVGALVEKENFVRVFPGYYCNTAGLDCWHPCVSMLTRENTDDCHSYGIDINVWTVNTPEQMETVYSLGCAGMITNYPDAALEWLKTKE